MDGKSGKWTRIKTKKIKEGEASEGPEAEQSTSEVKDLIPDNFHNVEDFFGSDGCCPDSSGNCLEAGDAGWTVEIFAPKE